MSREVILEGVESEVRDLVNARVESDDEKIKVHDPTEEEVEKLSEYVHSSGVIRGYKVPSEEKLILKLNQGDQA